MERQSRFTHHVLTVMMSMTVLVHSKGWRSSLRCEANRYLLLRALEVSNRLLHEDDRLTIPLV